MEGTSPGAQTAAAAFLLRPAPKTRDDIFAILLGATSVPPNRLADVAASLKPTTAADSARLAAILAGLYGRGGLPPHSALAPLPLKQIAEQAAIKPPTALAHLKHLQDEGKIKRVETPDGPRYAVLPYIRCEWVDPDRGINLAWQSSLPVDWRFPLVSRVPDPAAQAFLLEWLDRAEARGLLPPNRSRFEAQDPRPPSCQIVIYGSCARGAAHAKSDLDILLCGTLPRKATERLVDLAHEVGLNAARTPDVRAVDAEAWSSSSTAFRDAVQRDGKTVFTNQPTGELLESRGTLHG